MSVIWNLRGSYEGSFFPISFDIQVTTNTSSPYIASSISGTIDGNTVSLIAPGGSSLSTPASGPGANDNEYFPFSIVSTFSVNGFAFFDSLGAQYIFFVSSGTNRVSNNVGDTNVPLTVTEACFLENTPILVDCYNNEHELIQNLKTGDYVVSGENKIKRKIVQIIKAQISSDRPPLNVGGVFISYGHAIKKDGVWGSGHKFGYANATKEELNLTESVREYLTYYNIELEGEESRRIKTVYSKGVEFESFSEEKL